MSEHEIASQKKKEKADQSRHISAHNPQPLSPKLIAGDIPSYLIGDTPSNPPIQRHADLLSEAPSNELRAIIADQLQRTYGNGYLQRLVESMRVQTKLTISGPNDLDEREADRISDMVTRNLSSQVQRRPILQGRPEQEKEVQTQAADSQPEVIENLETRIKKAKGNGQPLPDTLREPMERAFGADFSGVHVHTDSEADALDQQLNARAFTTGQDIFFRRGEYSPNSGSGQKLIAHELAHTVQQGAPFRIARWGIMTTSHKTVTKDAFSGDGLGTKYSQDTQDYISSFADSMDMRFRMWWHYTLDKIKDKFVLKKIKSDPEAYEKLEGYELNEDEAKNHAEGGLYKSKGGEGANKERVQQNVEKAIAAWKAGNINQALSTLGLSLHTAEDRGAHGEGQPGKGHDPRRMIPAPEGSSVNYYKEGWENKYCDMKEHNEGGYTEAVNYAREVLKQFYESAQENEEPEGSFVIKMQPESGMEKLVRHLAICFGLQPEEVKAFWSEKVAALAGWSAEKLAALMNWSAEKLRVLMSWSVEKLTALASWSAEKLRVLMSWSVEKLTVLASWSVEKLTAMANWTMEKLASLAEKSVEKLTALASWTMEKLSSIVSWF